MRGDLVWDICAFVPSKAGLTKEVVFHEGGWSLKTGTTVVCIVNFMAMCI